MIRVGDDQMKITTDQPFRRRFASVALAGALAFAVTACDTEGNDGPETGAQPVAQGSDFPSDRISGVPLPSAAEPLTEPVEAEEGVTSQSFRLPGLTPEEAAADLTTLLTDDGWTVAQAPAERAQGFRAEFTKDGRLLELSTTPFNGFEDAPGDGESVISQFSIVIRTE